MQSLVEIKQVVIEKIFKDFIIYAIMIYMYMYRQNKRALPT